MKNIYSLSGWMVYGILLWIRTHHGDTDWAKSIVAIATSHCDCLQRRSNCLVRELFWLLQMEKSWMLWVSLWICTLLLCVCVCHEWRYSYPVCYTYPYHGKGKRLIYHGYIPIIHSWRYSIYTYPPVIKRGNWTSTWNGGFQRTITYE